MGKSVYLAAVLILLGGVALAQHAISLEPDEGHAAQPEPAASAPAVEPAAPQMPAPVHTTTVVPAPKVEVTFPAEQDVYIVPAATREVCNTIDFGFGDVQTDCRMEPLPVRAADPALDGICITRYGRRTCY
jgi:hypothetical protein